MLNIKLLLSYALDWLIILCIVAVGGGISFISPYHRPFSLLDLTISFPYVEKDLVSTAVLVVLSLVAPAVIILVYTAVLIPWPGKQSRTSRLKFWRRKLWEFNAGWMGLGLSFALALFITQGTKNLIGKPRPDLLARCQPDLTDITAHVLGGYGQDISQRWSLVSSTICIQKDKALLDEGFRSFFSGHSSMSWSGLLYLSLWLASKLNLSIPYLHPHNMIEQKKKAESEDSELLPMHEERDGAGVPSPPYKHAAAPPLFGVVLFLVPICVAFYICSTRYVDFKHQGIDIFSGAVLGIITSWLGFRLYHGSLTRGEGWAWSPRSTDKAFAVSSGVEGWAKSGVPCTRRLKTREDQESASGVIRK